jgi:hypothetical protein
LGRGFIFYRFLFHFVNDCFRDDLVVFSFSYGFELGRTGELALDRLPSRRIRLLRQLEKVCLAWLSPSRRNDFVGLVFRGCRCLALDFLRDRFL